MSNPILEEVVTHFVMTSQWPTYRDLEIRHRKEGPLSELLEPLVPDLMWADDPQSKEARVYATLRGLASTESGRDDAERVVQVVRHMADRYVETAGDVTVQSSELETSLGFEPEVAHRVCELFWKWGWGLTQGGSRSGDGQSYTFGVSRRVLPFEGVRTLTDFFKRLEERNRREGSGTLSGPPFRARPGDRPGIGQLLPSGQAVFLVHGHDQDNTACLKAFLEDQRGLEVIMLSDKPGRGRTIIEKFEEEAARAQYAFVLLTPDDFVGERDKAYSQARPNVVFELGWFYGRLGRERVCLVLREGTRLQSDLEGISRIVFEQSVLERSDEIDTELEEAGFLF